MDPQKPARAGRSPLLFIFLTVFIDLLGFGIVIPLLPIYSKAFQSSGLETGLLFSCFSGMQLIFAPMWGRLSDRIGRRPVLIGGLIGTAASYALFAHANSMALLYASRLLAGFFGANISVAQAYIADVTDAKDRAKGMGMIGAAFGLGFTFGPLLGGVLAGVAHVEGQLPPVPGYAAAALSLCAAVFGYFKLPEPARHSAGSRVFGMRQVREALANGRVGLLLLLNFFNIVAFACFETMFIYFGLAKFPESFNQPAAIGAATMDDVLRAAPIAGYYLFGVGVISALIQGGFIRRLVPRFGETRLAVAGPAILGVALGIIGGAPTWGVVIAGCILMPCGFGLSNPSVNGLLSRAVPAERQGAFLGLNQSGGSLARLLAPVFAGTLFGVFGARSPFFAACGLLLVSTLIAWTYHRRYAATFPRHGEAEVVAEG
ncbi:MAG: MFS transporter [Planctomycetes bacterium]|nr:MFS transporter [Planctomycetota bacterium]